MTEQERLLQTLAELQATVNDQRRTLTKKDEQIAQLSSQLASLANELDSLRSQSALEDPNRQLTVEQSHLSGECTQLGLVIEAQGRELAAIKNTIGWKILEKYRTARNSSRILSIFHSFLTRPIKKISSLRENAINVEDFGSAMKFLRTRFRNRHDRFLLFSTRKLTSSINHFFNRNKDIQHSDTAIVLHLFYLDLWPEIKFYLDNVEPDFDLYVSIPNGMSREVKGRILLDYPNAQVKSFANRGRDIAPFLSFLNDERLSKYKYVCKIHTKKSPDRSDGNRWRRELLQGVLGSKAIVRHIKGLFDSQSDLGLVGPKGHLLTSEEFWGSNRERVIKLASKMQLSPSQVCLNFFAGSMFWFRPNALKPIQDLKIQLYEFEAEDGQADATLAHALERLFPLAAVKAGYRMTDSGGREARSVSSRIETKEFKLIAFYLPQFHPIPENDMWWGKGFTEWTNVTKARPLFPGHRQPRLPADLGFYDLRVPEVRRSQADLAREYGIFGFCYYYYWFNGRSLLDRPLREVIQSEKPDFPFCICWANENWTRRWDGLDQEVLIEQTYTEESNQRFIYEIIPILKDRRYIRYQGKPVLLIYRVKAIPKVRQVVKLWREECRRQGVGEIHLCAVRFWDVLHATEDGFDAMIDFPPHHVNTTPIDSFIKGIDKRFTGSIYSYENVIRANLSTYQDGNDEFVHRGLMTGWDNTARLGFAAEIAFGATPDAFRRWLGGIIEQEFLSNRDDASLIFINAWNEWAEGAVLEPDSCFGRGYLEAVKQALTEATQLSLKRQNQLQIRHL